MAEQQSKIQKMSVEAAEKFASNVLVQWESPGSIRKMFAPKLNDEEFKFFMGMGIALGASPFAKEIFAVKYGQEPASIIVARALYRRKAQEQPDYGGCIIETVYPGEVFKPNLIDPLKTEHTPNYEKRREQEEAGIMPYGAYFIGIYRDGRIPIWHFCATKEYIKYIRDKQTGETRPTKFWKESPGTMIKKVVDSQGHRLMYQGVFRGTMTEDDIEASAHKIESPEDSESTDGVMTTLDDQIKGRTEEAPGKQPAPGVPADVVGDDTDGGDAENMDSVCNKHEWSDVEPYSCKCRGRSRGQYD
jgi:hypothetical protein